MAGLFILHTHWHSLDHLKAYQAAATKSIAAFGGRNLAYDPRAEVVEGESDLTATVIIEFRDLDTAKAWYQSPEYQEALPLRLQSSNGVARFVESR